MEQNLQAQIDTYLSHLDALIRRGRQVRDALAAEPSNPSAVSAIRAWQEHCGTTINQLSGGSKAHWLARAFSNAFLVRSVTGGAVEDVPPGEIVDRLIDVLEQAVASLSQDSAGIGSPAPAPPAPRRFDFVHNPDLRPVLEQAFRDSQTALDQGHYEEALHTSCGILEAIVTDALEHRGFGSPSVTLSTVPAGTTAAGTTIEETTAERTTAGGTIAKEKIADWSFAKRLAVAEQSGLIRGGCARLPAAARSYRDHPEGHSQDHLEDHLKGQPDAEAKSTPISERDATLTAQVLRVIMRDLDPGR